MTEQKVKKRAWVKNAAIIFLSVMLVLTFFSNTIMNHSLPEVAAAYVQSGAINAKIRGSGTVTAIESYEVKSEQSREVLSVPVQVGDEVKVGDTLVLYSDAESSQLKEAETALDALILAYQKALLQDTSGNYAKENRAIQQAQLAYDKAKAKRDTLTPVTAAEIAAAKANYSRAQTNYNSQSTIVSNLEAQFQNLSQPTDNSSEVAAASNAVAVAQVSYDAALLANKIGYENLKKCAEKWMADDSTAAQKTLAVCMAALAQKYTALLDLATFPSTKPSYIPVFPADDPSTDTDPTYSEASITEMVNAYTAVNPKEKALTAAKNTLSEAYATGGGDYNYYAVKNQLAAARTTLTTYQNHKESCEAAVTDITTRDSEYNTADAAVTTAQDALQTAMDNLADSQIKAGVSGLELAAQQKQIAEQTEALAKLKAGGEGASVESKVNGIVAAINVSAGKTAEADAVMMTIEVPDMGYGISFSVTTEQSKKVKVGDPAEITNYYYGGDISATLIAIKSDPQNPGTNKILSFKLQGEVESGTQLAVTIGERGGSYDSLVPNSAIRSDNNGKFVLIVVAKSSPLGNRYIATRIDVKVLASDDVNTAVSGALTTSDMVITTSTKPIEPSSQVRLAD